MNISSINSAFQSSIPSYFQEPSAGRAATSTQAEAVSSRPVEPSQQAGAQQERPRSTDDRVGGRFDAFA
jgi:hypothetical protein